MISKRTQASLEFAPVGDLAPEAFCPESCPSGSFWGFFHREVQKPNKWWQGNDEINLKNKKRGRMRELRDGEGPALLPILIQIITSVLSALAS